MPRDQILLGGLAIVILIFHAACGYSQSDGKRQPTQATTQSQTTVEGETLKERLSDKASDEQRVNNCKVALDRRGPKIRPEGCRPDDAGAALIRPPQ